VSRRSAAARTPAAVTLDYWDTLYEGGPLPARVEYHRAVLADLLAEAGHPGLSPEEFAAARAAAGEQALRWWRDEQRGFSPEDVLRAMLRHVGVDRPAGCSLVAGAVARGEEALDRHPPALLPGAGDTVRALAAAGVRLAVVSDTGFTTGAAQNRVLARDGLLDLFVATVYSDECGHAKPRPEPYRLALAALGVAPADALHVGDLEETDVAGALAFGMRAVRLDVAQRRGPSRAEFVAGDHWALKAYLLGS
jgi:putative hydrolase of the HAD superfamily